MLDNLRYLAPPAGAAEFTPAEREALDKVNARIAAAKSLEAAMAFLFEATRAVSPCDRIGLSFLDEDGRRIVAHHAVAAYEPLLLKKGYAEELHGSSLERVIGERAPRIINDLEAYLAAHPKSASTKLLLREGVRSSMTCPLFVDDRVAGLLFRSSREKGAYDESHVRLHQAMAERIGQAVEKAYRIDRLEAVNAAYTEMLGFVAHELKSPLSSIIMDGNVLGDGYLGALEPAQRDKVGRMVGKAEYLLNLVREYLDLARIESGALELNAKRSVRFAAEVVAPSIDIVRPQLEEKKMRLALELDEALACDCDPELMKIAVVNLVGNGVKYGTDGGEVRVRLAREGDRLRLAVRNEGPGFPPSMRGRLFRKFSRLETPELKKRKGTGVGLYTTWRIVDLHGGRIDATSQEGAWAEFTFEIPLALAERA
jgi:signal transduction histidine kinase